LNLVVLLIRLVIETVDSDLKLYHLRCCYNQGLVTYAIEGEVVTLIVLKVLLLVDVVVRHAYGICSLLHNSSVEEALVFFNAFKDGRKAI